MIRAAFSSLAGAWIARNVEQGESRNGLQFL